MYRFSRTVVLKNTADTPAALGYAGEITAFVNQAIDTDMKFGVEMFNGGRIHWHLDVSSLAEFEEKFAAIMSNADYFPLIERGRKLFQDGSLQDTIVKIIG